MNLGGRTVLLTGATGGVGGAVARALAGRGATVVLSGRRVEPLAALAAEIGGRAVAADLSAPDAPARLVADAGDVDVLVANAALPASGELTSFSDDEIGGRAVAADLSAPDAPARLVADAGDVDVLVANAALPASGELTSFSEDEIDRALAVNLRAPIQLARLLGPPMTARRAGHMVFVSSLSGRTAGPHSSLYSATKFGLRGFSLGLRQDLAEYGVGVSCVFPGFVRDAGMFADSGATLPPGVGTSTPGDVAA